MWGLFQLVVWGWAVQLPAVLAGPAKVGGLFLNDATQLALEREEAGVPPQVPVDALGSTGSIGTCTGAAFCSTTSAAGGCWEAAGG